MEETPEGRQETYIPPGYLNPPSGSQFANATWMHAGGEFKAVVERMLLFEEFDDIRTLPFGVVWRRKSAPTRRGDPIFASIWVPEERVIWEMAQREEEFPRYIVDLHWQHFEALRSPKEEGASPEFVHRDVLARHVHEALSSLEIDNDILRRVPPDAQVYTSTVRRFGDYTGGVGRIRQQFSLFEQDVADGLPAHYLAQD